MPAACLTTSAIGQNADLLAVRQAAAAKDKCVRPHRAKELVDEAGLAHACRTEKREEVRRLVLDRLFEDGLELSGARARARPGASRTGGDRPGFRA